MTSTLRRPAARNGVYYAEIRAARRMDRRDWVAAVLVGAGVAVSIVVTVALLLGAVWLILASLKAIAELVR